jgi:catechol 2,3-dioxygenase-like lactoylglutathione lyase family enzyme
MSKGIVSARHVDHVGFTVPDLDAAIEFFERALGADLLWKLGPFDETPTGVNINSINLANAPPGTEHQRRTHGLRR